MTYEEYLKELPFLQERVLEIIRKYNNSEAHERLKQRTNALTAKMKYCSGADIHRGVLNPNYLEDWKVGGMHRGRFISCYRGGKYAYRYRFDAEDALICADYKDNEYENSEYIIYDNDLCWGLEYWHNSETNKYILQHLYCTKIQSGRVVWDMVLILWINIESRVWVFDYKDDIPVTVTERIDRDFIPDFLLLEKVPEYLSSFYDSVKKSWRQEDHTLYSNADGQIECFSTIEQSTGHYREYPPFYMPKPLDATAWRNTYGLNRCGAASEIDLILSEDYAT